jgi:hypothetical protein
MNIIKTQFFLIFTLLVLLSNMVKGQKSIFDPSIVHEICIEVEEEIMAEGLTYFKRVNRDKDYIPANVLLDGNRLDTIGFRTKGHSSFIWATNEKKPFKLDFNEYVKGQSFQGLKKINLHNGAGDPTFLREHFAYYILREMGIPAPETAFTELYINDEYWGLYLIVEQIDNDFLKKHFQEKSGALIKNRRNYKMGYSLGEKISLTRIFDIKTKKDDVNLQKFNSFFDFILNADNQLFENKIDSLFDVQLFINILAARLAIVDRDSFYSNGHNYYLYYNEQLNKIQMIPWDLNLAMGAHLSNKRERSKNTCLERAYFTHAVENNQTYHFTNHSTEGAENDYWDFGDGTYSNEKSPTHRFKEEGRYTVCLTVESDDYNVPCKNERCKIIRTRDYLQACSTDIPDSLDNELLQKVFELCADCCEKKWDWRCNLRYLDLAIGGTGYYEESIHMDFDLFPEDAANPLVARILHIPEYREYYLERMQFLIDHLLDPEMVNSFIITYSKIIEKSIGTDDLYPYPKDMFIDNLGMNEASGITRHPFYNTAKLIPFLHFRQQEIKDQIATHLM